jgi:tRNA 2-thiouridine synthesizing protein C
MNTSSSLPTLAIVNRSAPYGSASGQESLDLTLAAASFGQTLSLFFIDDGVYQLFTAQAPESINAKNYSKTFAALEFYDIEQIYVCEESLLTRGITGPLCVEVTRLKRTDLRHLLNQHQHILNF